MARQPTTIGLIAKWLVVPLAFGAIGYFGIGPRLSGHLDMPTATRPVLEADEPDERPRVAPSSDGPKIEVSSKKRPARRTSTPKKAKPAATAPPSRLEPAPSTDEDDGGSAGAGGSGETPVPALPADESGT